MLGTADQPPCRLTDPVPVDDLLTGGSPRTLHHVDEVVQTVSADPERVDKLIACDLQAGDQVVRMHADDALEKVCRAQPLLIQPHVWQLLGNMTEIAQPSVQRPVAQMLGHVQLTAPQRRRAAQLMNKNLDESSDWIVLSCQLARHEHSHFTSLANRARTLSLEFGPDPTAPTTTGVEGRT